MPLRRLQATAVLLIPCHIKIFQYLICETLLKYIYFVAMSPMVNQIFLVKCTHTIRLCRLVETMV